MSKFNPGDVISHDHDREIWLLIEFLYENCEPDLEIWRAIPLDEYSREVHRPFSAQIFIRDDRWNVLCQEPDAF